MKDYRPRFLTSIYNGSLQKILEEVERGYYGNGCLLCPRRCGAKRREGETGYCGSDDKLKIAGYMLHHGEEPPISSANGSGTIFFSNCPLRCSYCQNYAFSQCGEGIVIDEMKLAGIMLELQANGAHNINLVTPEHFLPQIIKAILLAGERGLEIPIVYNSSGYIRSELAGILSRFIDIFLMDIRYFNHMYAMRYSNANDYPDVVKTALQAIAELGYNCLMLDSNETACFGLVIRHLVMPNGVSSTQDVLKWVSDALGRDTHISLMSQYTPCYKAVSDEMIGRRLTAEEYNDAVEALKKYGLRNGWVQPDFGLDEYMGQNLYARKMKR